MIFSKSLFNWLFRDFWHEFDVEINRTIKQKKSDFEEMLKINGATTLSHLIRSYIHTNTAISGMPNIIVPMINFVQFFKENEIK